MTFLNSFGTINAVTDTKTFTVSSWNNGSITPEIGREIMIFISSRKSADELLGYYCFSRIANIDDKTVTLEDDITNENGYDFTINADLISAYEVRAIIVPNFNTLTVNSGVAITNASGFIVFRVKGDCTINGSILTHGSGNLRNDLIQMTHSKLVDTNAMNASVNKELQSSMGSMINNLANRGVLNSSVTTAGTNQLSQAAADAFNKNYLTAYQSALSGLGSALQGSQNNTASMLSTLGAIGNVPSQAIENIGAQLTPAYTFGKDWKNFYLSDDPYETIYAQDPASSGGGG